MTAKNRNILALIPARGGSKGIPRKNVRLIAGKPLIAYSIEHALRSQHIGRVMVSTDDEEIAAAARAAGAEVPFMRPVEYAQDMSPDIDVFRHALQWLREKENYTPELVVHLRPTGPVRRVELIDQAIGLMLAQPTADSLRSVSVPTLTPYKMWRVENGFLKPLLSVPGVKDPHSMPRQMLPEVYWQNGYVDIVRPRTILGKSSMTGDTVLPFIVTDQIYELDYEDSIPELEQVLQALARGERVSFTQERRHAV
ncbi:MAG TPA: acylneuraminate cytidylyltransferase family protein [Opitutales bacterium]|jgi:CMP-N,N'-diacetyllegionaminic acid synthase|nr:acylneuraminate cytidylyltransferase family protein [Opitutales bacterium]